MKREEQVAALVREAYNNGVLQYEPDETIERVTRAILAVVDVPSCHYCVHEGVVWIEGRLLCGAHAHEASRPSSSIPSIPSTPSESHREKPWVDVDLSRLKGSEG